MKYNYKKTEKKWQQVWEEKKPFSAKDFDKKKKFYCLIEFPYPSGDGLHVGHIRPYTALDIVARKKRMQGYNVLYPFGFDAFGLPTENYAIKTGIHPAKVTAKNIKKFTGQLKKVGFSFDWDRVICTSDPKYYKWTQWIFLKMFENGLAYKDKIAINWCVDCKIGLANEEVVDGTCERCGGKVEKREKEQWMLKITNYADRLIKDLNMVDYLDRIKLQQINWIGRSEGAEVNFGIKNSELKIKVYTTRPDTLFGATFMVVAPEHEIVKGKLPITNKKEVDEYVNFVKKKSDLERLDLTKDKTGVELKGIKAINPVNNEEIPIFVADYVLQSYGTGAIMAVPAHDQRDFEFAKKFGLKIKQVIKAQSAENSAQALELTEAYEDIEKGVMINSGQFNGLQVKECIKKIIIWLEKEKLGKATVNYKLRDWVFSRQRYWGEPIPLVFCPACKNLVENFKRQNPNFKQASSSKSKFSQGELLNPGWVAVLEKSLPLELPPVKKYEPTNTGESPLATIKNWTETVCPKCGGKAKRETDTMPNWAGSNWYYLAYLMKKISNFEFPILNYKEVFKYWMPVDWYNGGMEHTTLHLLYSRFIYKVLWDIGVVPKDCGFEPYKKRTAHGMILGENNEKMSKSRGNVVTPDEVIEEFGADALRIYEMFIGPFEQTAVWDSKGILGVKRFLDKAWLYGVRSLKCKDSDPKFQTILHQTIKKVSDDVETMKFNTAVSALMILVNEMDKGVDKKSFEKFLIILAPFAPHIAEELWEKLGNKDSVHNQNWPKYDEKLAREDEIELVIQVNGKVRDRVKAPANIVEEKAKEVAFESANVKKIIQNKKVKKIIFVKGRLINIVV